MSVHVVRLGTPRVADEGLRIGTVRRPPRGVPKADYARLDYYDVWLPNLAPSAELMGWLKEEPITPQRWREFARRYHAEMSHPEAQHLLETLAALSHRTNFSVGCYCEDEAHCHRSLLRRLFEQLGGKLA